MVTKINIISEKCCGCRICELTCSLVKESTFNPRKALIRVEIDRNPISDVSKSKIDVPITCEQCDPAPCETACPSDAFYRNVDTGALLINPDQCTGCELCISACPHTLIWFDPLKRIAKKCDLCGGIPHCVKNCPSGALQT